MSKQRWLQLRGTGIKPLRRWSVSVTPQGARKSERAGARSAYQTCEVAESARRRAFRPPRTRRPCGLRHPGPSAAPRRSRAARACAGVTTTSIASEASTLTTSATKNTPGSIHGCPRRMKSDDDEDDELQDPAAEHDPEEDRHVEVVAVPPVGDQDARAGDREEDAPRRARRRARSTDPSCRPRGTRRRRPRRRGPRSRPADHTRTVRRIGVLDTGLALIGRPPVRAQDRAAVRVVRARPADARHGGAREGRSRRGRRRCRPRRRARRRGSPPATRGSCRCT